MLSKNLENSTSYDIFYNIWKKARVYYILSISRGAQAPAPLDSPLTLTQRRSQDLCRKGGGQAFFIDFGMCMSLAAHGKAM